ncbi:hypothetical protein Xmau_00407 [Xenorhabdus mauleonii]|uniref:Uncharacterized protein n=1 Tax=Xenorhabdus mauleonii TaxID=351675 RepID=A0A1I3IW77_9GAMM|nr:MW1434 family type I TA system toxin [Xenorhabdus mauleonii]PHM46014.1 hypothetical protein Xmau_00407 [Xenorhabdus mauleonii]SFI52157.1 Protein of unknown function [Xenorhabdus mauleonii]
MSEVNKPENKNPANLCQIDPKQYQIDAATAPVGSFPWAMIQVYKGKNLRRKDWDSPDQYLRLISSKEVEAGTEQNDYIEAHDKHGHWKPWIPNVEDMVECDWEVVKVKPKIEDYRLSFDLKIGTARRQDWEHWGYMNFGDINPDKPPFGVLTNLRSNIDVGKILSFRFCKQDGDRRGFILLQIDTPNYPELGYNSCNVTVDGSIYGIFISNWQNKSGFNYPADGANRLGDLIKQNVDKTLHFSLKWK